MKNKITTIAATTLVISSLVLAIPVFAAESSSTATKLTKVQTRAENAIDSRVTSLDKLLTQLQGLKNVSDSGKASLNSAIQGVVNSLNILKAEIASDTATTTLKTHTQEITQANRVYALVIPQTRIIAAGDRVQTIVAMMGAISTKLQTRISMATTTSTTTLSSIQTAMTDLSVKLSDANTQAVAAISEVSALTPDMGDKTKMVANTAALKDARTKIQAANKDISVGRKDISTVIKALVKDIQSLNK